MYNFLNVKKQVKTQLANVSYFEVKFTTTSTCNAFKFVKPGSVRKFTRTGPGQFKMGQARDLITAVSIAHVIAHNEGQIIFTKEK